MENKVQQISWGELERLSYELSSKIPREEFQAILCISSGGVVLGKLLSDYSNLPLAIIAAKAYNKGDTNISEEVLIGNITTIKPLQGKILLVDDLVDTGKTMQKIYSEIKRDPAITEIRTATIFTKPHSTFAPDYYLQETPSWIIFPYEKREFERISN